MTIRLGVVMDPIARIKIGKDSTFAMLLEAQRRGWALRYFEAADLAVSDGEALGRGRSLLVRDDPSGWFELGDAATGPLSDLDVILMRKDPPFNMDYVYATYVLDLAEAAGTLVVNRPAALRDTNEKVAISRFPQVCPPTLITAQQDEMHAFIKRHGEAILKPLDGMGGASIFRVAADDQNRNVIVETMTAYGSRFAMAQGFVPEISEGDKRILVIDGHAVPYALARIPAAGEARANLAAGGTGVGIELTERDRWIVDQVAPYLQANGLLFAGLDVIGDYLTEINVTSPTCIRELDSMYGLNIAGDLMDVIELKLSARSN